MITASCLLLVLFHVVGDGKEITVHLIAHSHDDVGWLWSFEDNYVANVSRILTNVVDCLLEDPNRRFNWEEVCFFARWWEDQDNHRRDEVRQLVQKGQMEFVSGMWVQSDEGSVHYQAAIEQTTLGHQFLLNSFGPGLVLPRTSWQIDIWGHSSVTPSLLTMLGFTAHVTNRMDYRIRDEYKSEQRLEFFWQGSPSLKTQIFSHELDSFYTPPIGFDFERGDPPITPDNVQSRSIALMDNLLTRASWFRTPNLLVPVGNDEAFEEAELQFSNWERLMDYINSNSSFGTRLQWSTLSTYFETVLSNSSVDWPVYRNYDFNPYRAPPDGWLANKPGDDEWWSGAFTSRPTFKRLAFVTEIHSRAVDIVFALAYLAASHIRSQEEWQHMMAKLDDVKNQVGLVQHMDAKSGTTVEYVLQDFTERLEDAEHVLMDVAANATGFILCRESPDRLCDPSLTAEPPVLPNGTMVVVAFNPLASFRMDFVRIPVAVPAVVVLNSNLSRVPSQIVVDDSAQHFVVFPVSLPPLGFDSYFVRTSDSQVQEYSSQRHYVVSAPTVVENQHFVLNFSDSGLMTSIFNKDERMLVKLSGEYMQYQNGWSDAYVFDPSGEAVPLNIRPTVDVREGDVLTEVTQRFSSSFTTITRLFHICGPEVPAPCNIVEVQHYVGPLDEDREAIVRYSSDLDNQGVFYTDDSALETLARRFNESKGIAGSYYPMNSHVFIREGESTSPSSRQLFILGNQAHGSSALAPGDLEIMLHRRLLTPRVALPVTLNDTTVTRPTFWLYVGSPNASETRRPSLTLQLHHPVLTFFGTVADPSEWLTSFVPNLSPSPGLPDNVHLLTFRPSVIMGGNGTMQFWLRLNHIYEEPAHTPFSVPVEVDVCAAFPGLEFSNVGEYTLSLTQKLEDVDNFTVHLAPIQIKSYAGQVHPTNHTHVH